MRVDAWGGRIGADVPSAGGEHKCRARYGVGMGAGRASMGRGCHRA